MFTDTEVPAGGEGLKPGPGRVGHAEEQGYQGGRLASVQALRTFGVLVAPSARTPVAWAVTCEGTIRQGMA